VACRRRRLRTSRGGLGDRFYGPPIYLQAIQETKGWPVPLISTAVTTHFVVGALVVATLPTLYARFGIPNATKAGALFLAIGVLSWASAAKPWQLYAATLFSGAGWAAMSGAAVNAIISPWFVRTRPAALSMAYNGASIGGLVFSPLWGGGYRPIGLSDCRRTDRHRHGACDVGTCRPASFPDASADGIAARQ
jgi:MFS family permease